MFRIKENNEFQIEIEKSKFICYLGRVFNEQEAKDFLLSIKKLHPNATHHCYAFIIGDNQQIQRSNDNGEPSGTAGVPILEALKKNNLTDCIAVVVRYFGGIKLGAGGLIRAYTKSCVETINNSILVETILTNVFTINFNYDLIKKIDYLFEQQHINIIDKEYSETVRYTYHTTKDLNNALSELSNGKIIPKLLEQQLIEVPIKKV